MDAKKEALEIYENLVVYTWDKKNGFVDDDKATLKAGLFHIDKIINLVGVMRQGQMIISYWTDVRKEYINLINQRVK